MSPLPAENVDIELHHRDFAFGRQLVGSLIGAGRATHPYLAAVVSGPEGTHEFATEGFVMMFSTPLEHLEGTDRENGFEALDRLSSQLRRWGFDLVDRGQVPWYFRQFARPHIPIGKMSATKRQQRIAAVEEYLEDNPDSSHAWASMAYFAKEDREWRKAISHAREAIARNKENVLALAVMGEAYMFLGKPGLAIKYSARAARLMPGYEYPEDVVRDLTEKFPDLVAEHLRSVAPASEKTNTLAKVSLGVAVLAGPFALPLAIVALRQTASRGEKGAGLAWIAVAIGGAMMLCVIPGLFAN